MVCGWRSSLLALSVGATIALLLFAFNISSMDVPLTAVGRYTDRGSRMTGSLAAIIKHMRHLSRSSVALHMLVTDKANPTAPVYMRDRLAQIVFILSLIFIEGQRARASKKLSRFPKLWILLLHPLTFPIALPLYCYFDLAPQTDREARMARLPLPAADLANLCLSVLLGFGIPAIMIFDPLQQGQYVQMKWTRVFVLFPLNVVTLQFAFESVFDPRIFDDLLNWAQMSSHEAVQCLLLVLAIPSSSSHSFAFVQALAAVYERFWGSPTSTSQPLYDQVLVYRAIEFFFTTTAIVIWTSYKVELKYPWHNMTFVLAFALGSLVCGPISCLSAVWSRHERVMMDDPEHERLE